MCFFSVKVTWYKMKTRKDAKQSPVCLLVCQKSGFSQVCNYLLSFRHWFLPVRRLLNGNTFSRLSTRKNYNWVTSFFCLVPHYLLSTGAKRAYYKEVMKSLYGSSDVRVCLDLKFDKKKLKTMPFSLSLKNYSVVT